MDIELQPEQLLPQDVEAIASSALTHGGLDLAGVISLLSHIEWQGEEIERLGEERDALRDAQPPSSALASRAKRALDELADAKALLTDVRRLVGIPDSADPITAIGSIMRLHDRRAIQVNNTRALLQKLRAGLREMDESLHDAAAQING